MTGPRNYIEEIAFDVFRASGKTGDMPESELALWVNYAVLVLTKGTDTTSADVHEAWSAWATVHHNGEHRSLIPFNQLTPEIQAYDDLYRDAIHQVSAAKKPTQWNRVIRAMQERWARLDHEAGYY